MKKIILGEKKFIGNQNEDNFLEVELSREVETLKIDSLDNVFDYQNQFIKERNESFKFCLYGIVESRYGHCDNLALNIHVKDTKFDIQTQKTVIYTPYINHLSVSGTDFTILSKPLSKNSAISKNIYGTNKGCYFFYFELIKEEITSSKSIFFEIFDQTNELYGKFSIPFIFFDFDGESLEFGTESAEFNNANEIETIDNNFPFFYDKHWIKFNIEPHGPFIVYFEAESLTLKENEVSTISIPVSLESPSIYGNEKAKVIIDLGLDEYGKPFTTASFINDFTFNEQVVEWAIGEQIKYVTIDILNDLFVENIEKIQLRIVPIVNTRINIDTNNSMILYIESEDLPTSIFFDKGKLDIQRPLFSSTISSPDLLNLYSSYLSIPSINNIQLNLTSPILVGGEKIRIKYLESISNGKITQDFILDPDNPTATERVLNITIGVSAVTIDILVKSYPGYVLEKNIVLELSQETLGIVPVSQSINNAPRIDITLKDSTLYQYTKFIVPVNPNNNIGLYKTIFYHSFNSNDKTVLKKEQINPTGYLNVSQTGVTNHFTCDLTITNLGESIIWNGNLIPKLGNFTININAFNLINDIEFELPANLIWQGNYFTQCYYDFKFTNFEKTYPTTIPSSSTQYDIYNKFDNVVIKDSHTAGISNKHKRYLHTEVSFAISTYDETNGTCGIEPLYLNLTEKLLYGSALFTAASVLTDRTFTRMIFSNKLVSTECSKVNNSLPIGKILIGQGPFIEQTTQLYLGSIYSQINYDINNSNKEMFCYAITNNSVFTNSYRYFYGWDLMSLDSKNSLELEIVNNGIRDVVVLNKTIAPNSSEKYVYPEIDFENMVINLVANDNYLNNTNTFLKFDYSFRLNNIKIPHQIINNSTFETIPTLSLGNYIENVVINNNLATNRTRFLQCRHNDVKLIATVVSNLNCNGNVITSPWNITKDLYVNDILLYANIGSSLKTIEFVNQVITPSCSMSTIPFKII